MKYKSILRLGSIAHPLDKFRPIHVTTQNMAGLLSPLETISVVLFLMTH